MALTPEQHQEQLTTKFINAYTKFIRHQVKVNGRGYDEAHMDWMNLSIDDPRWPDGDEDALRSYGIKSEYIAGIIRTCMDRVDTIQWAEGLKKS